MTENEKKVKNPQRTISGIGKTESNLTGELAFFVKYIKKIKVLNIIVKEFDGLRKNRKGTALKKDPNLFSTRNKTDNI